MPFLDLLVNNNKHAQAENLHSLHSRMSQNMSSVIIFFSLHVHVHKSFFVVVACRSPVWMQCEECLKWRSVPAHHYSSIPESWNCSQNPNSRYRCVCSFKCSFSKSDTDHIMRHNHMWSYPNALCVGDKEVSCGCGFQSVFRQLNRLNKLSALPGCTIYSYTFTGSWVNCGSGTEKSPPNQEFGGLIPSCHMSKCPQARLCILLSVSGGLRLRCKQMSRCKGV